MKRKIFSKLLMGAFLIASVSMFVSCKDYDDDISKNSQEITALKSQLETLKSTLSSDLSSAKSELNTAIADKASAADLTKLEARVAALETQIKAIDECAKKSDLDAVSALLAVLDGDVKKAQETADAAKTQADLQKEALDNFKKSVADAGYLTEADKTALNKAIEELKKQIGDLTISEDVEAMKKQFNDLETALTQKIDNAISVLTVLVDKKLTSIVLKPDFYWEGIEGIEVPSAYPAVFVEAEGKEFDYYVYQWVDGVYTPVKGDPNVKVVVDKTMKYKRDANNNIVFATLSSGGVASYHINPSVADVEGAEISFFENNAEVYTRAEGWPSINATPKSPILKNSDVVNGIIKVPFTADYDQIWKYFSKWAFDNNTRVNSTYGGGTATKYGWTQMINWRWVYKTDDNGDYVLDENGNRIRDYINYPKVYEPTWDSDSPSSDDYGTSNYDKLDDKGNYLYTYQDIAPLPFIAAQISTKDTVVTSDYAVVVPAVYEILALGDSDPDVILDQNTFENNHTKSPFNPNGAIRDNHLYVETGWNGASDTWSTAAIPMPATHQVVYTDKINLRPFIETHYNLITYTRYGQSKYDQKMDDATLEALGLEYHFIPVGYRLGKNATDETMHIQRVDENGNASDDVTSGWFAPRSVTVENNPLGEQIPNVTATQEAVDREPLIRVDLVKKETQEIVMYGYIKLRIVKDKVNDIDVAIDLGEMWMNCGEEKAITWAQVENLILAKLGTDGMTKQDFENNYYLEVEGNKTEMPTNRNGGRLYNSDWRAKRYYVKEVKDGKWVVEAATTDFAKYTADNNRFGRVWFTPYDNATSPQPHDAQTNVLMWNLTNDATAGKTDNSASFKAAYAKMIEVLGATYKTKGENTNELSTVVRFTNKNNGTHVNVKLSFQPNKIHFAYGDINRRILDHWYDFKTGYKDMTADTIEVYANVPTPAEVARPALGTFSDAKGVTPFGFKKDLTEYWLDQRIIVDMYNTQKFSKFANNDVTFRFRYPKSGENTEEGCNTADLDIDPVASDKDHLNVLVWQAKGASGRTWYVGLNAKKDQILAYGYSLPGKADIIDYRTVAGGPGMAVPICTLTAQGEIHWLGRIEETAAPYLMPNNTLLAENQENVNEPANDILNYIGMYNKSGDSQKDTYLSGQKEKTFAAYVEILVANDACYDPIIGKNYFNVRFLRPINAWPAQTIWKDAPNTTQIYDIWRLLNIRDWRTYAVVLDNQKQRFDDGRITYDGNYVDGEKASVPYSFYNIQNLYIERAEIRSDAYLNASERSAYLTETAIAKLRTIDAIPALTGKNTNGSGRWEYFKIVDSSTSATAAGNTALGKAESTSSTDKIAYTNNGGVLKEFHIFVPISIEYSHGALKPWTQRVWAVITVDPTVGNE